MPVSRTSIPPTPGVYETILESCGYGSIPYRNAMFALTELVRELDRRHPGIIALNRFAAEGFRYLETSPMERAMLVGDEPSSEAIRALCREDRGAACTAVAAVRGHDVVLRQLLGAGHDLEPGTPGFDLFVELAGKPSHARLVDGLLANLRALTVLERPLTPAFERYARSDRIGGANRTYFALATQVAAEADLSSEQEEVYYTLALDGMEYHEAAEATLALV